MKRKVKLVIADIDGTLVSYEKIMGEKTKEMLRKLHEDGVLLGIASGRPCGEHLKARAEGWGFDFQFDVIIGMNGGQLWDMRNNKQFEYYPLKKEYIKEILDFMDITGANSYVYKGDTTLVRWDDERMRASSKRNGEPMMVAKNDEEMWGKDNNKLLFRCATAEEADYCMEVAQAHQSPNYQFFKTSPTMVEFQDPRVNKGVALKAYCQMNNIDLSEVVAFGDQQNDDKMLEAAGLGVAILGGGESTLSIADDVTRYSNNEDGVGYYIQEKIY